MPVYSSLSLRFLGRHRVVGIARWTEEGVQIEGEVPNKKIQWKVMK